MTKLCTMKKKNNNTSLYKITLGNPTMDCRRYGICRIDDFDERMATHAPDTVLAKIKKTDTTLIFTFLRHTMTECTFKTHFSSGFFQIEQSFIWQGKTVLEGIYPIQQMGNELITPLSILAFEEAI